MSFRTRKALVWMLLILNMTVIFILSAQPADISTSESDVLVSLPQYFYELAHPESAGNYDVYLLIQFIIRKTAHFLEFAFLAVWASILLALYQLKYPCLLGGVFSMLYAASDEIHQLFVPGRDGKWSDWIIDGCGAFIGALCALYLLRQFHSKRNKQRHRIQTNEDR